MTRPPGEEAFHPQGLGGPKRWAWALGVVLPIVLVALDPAVFRNGQLLPVKTWTPAVLGGVKPFAYVAIAQGVVVLAYALLARRPRPFVTGLLGASACFALGLGLCLIPASLIGLVFHGLGALGFLPFVVSYVYFTWARHARATLAPTPAQLWSGAAVFVLLAGAAQFGGSRALRVSIEDVLANDPEREAVAITRLRLWSPLLNLGPLAELWARERDDLVRKRIAAFYREVTGEDIRNEPVWIREA